MTLPKLNETLTFMVEVPSLNKKIQGKTLSGEGRERTFIRR